MIREQQSESRISSAFTSSTPHPHNRQLGSGIGHSDEVRAINPAEPSSNLTTNNRSLSTPTPLIAVVDQHSFTRGCITKWLKNNGEDIEVISFPTAEDCLQSSSAFDLILFHGHESAHDTNDARLAPVRKLT